MITKRLIFGTCFRRNATGARRNEIDSPPPKTFTFHVFCHWIIWDDIQIEKLRIYRKNSFACRIPSSKMIGWFYWNVIINDILAARIVVFHVHFCAKTIIWIPITVTVRRCIDWSSNSCHLVHSPQAQVHRQINRRAWYITFQNRQMKRWMETIFSHPHPHPSNSAS